MRHFPPQPSHYCSQPEWVERPEVLEKFIRGGFSREERWKRETHRANEWRRRLRVVALALGPAGVVLAGRRGDVGGCERNRQGEGARS